MDAVDGNAIGGLLIDVFGAEMTAASSTCATCGATRPVAELVVYRRAPAPSSAAAPAAASSWSSSRGTA
jgi:hypothetical protein